MDSYHILLVDDEILAIKGVRSSIAWDQLGAQKVSVAYSMRQAQKVFEEGPVDVMLCDIEMPGGSGLDLLQWVHENYPETVTLFLTCHSSFTYAQKAIALGASGYLLKPAPYAQLQEMLAEAVEKRRTMRENHQNRRYRSLWNDNKTIIAQRFWLDLLQDDSSVNLLKLLQEAQSKNIPLKETDIFLSVLIRIQEYDTLLMEWNRRELNFALNNIIEEIFSLSGGVPTILTPEDDIRLILIQGENLPENAANAACSQLCEIFSTYLDRHIRCFISKPASLPALPNDYRALRKLDADIIQQKSHIYHLGESVSPDRFPSDGGAMLKIDMGEWLFLLTEGNGQALLPRVMEYLDRLERLDSCGRNELRRFCHNFIQMIYLALIRRNILAQELFRDPALERLYDRADTDIPACRKFVRKMIEVVNDHLFSSSQTQSVVERVKQYIDSHLQSELTREQISHHVYLNPDYLSRLFKREEQLSISDYICKKRMEYAKLLLESTDESVSEICAKVGYVYNSHFSKMFKRETGMSPADYRKAHVRQTESQSRIASG